jgi:hypothetical protein
MWYPAPAFVGKWLFFTSNFKYPIFRLTQKWGFLKIGDPQRSLWFNLMIWLNPKWLLNHFSIYKSIWVKIGDTHSILSHGSKVDVFWHPHFFRKSPFLFVRSVGGILTVTLDSTLVEWLPFFEIWCSPFRFHPEEIHFYIEPKRNGFLNLMFSIYIVEIDFFLTHQNKYRYIHE